MDTDDGQAVNEALPGDDEEEFACLRGGSCGDGDWCDPCWKRYYRDCGKEMYTYSKLPQEPEEPTNQKGGGKRKKINLSATTDLAKSKRQRSEADWYGQQKYGDYETTRRRAAGGGEWEESQTKRVKERYIVDDPGVNPDLNGTFAYPPNWPVPKGGDPDMSGRGKNSSKKRAATLDGEQGDGDAPNFDLEVNTDPNVPDDPVLWHNHMFPRRNTPKGRLVQWHGWELGWLWIWIPQEEGWTGWIEGWRRDGERWAYGGHGKNPESGEWVQICEEQATKLNGVGLAAGSASNQLHVEFRCEGPGCKVVYRNRGLFAAIEAVRNWKGELVPADTPGNNRLVTTGSPLIFVVQDDVRDQVSGKKQRSEVGQARSSQAYDERAAKNKVGGAQLSLCFTRCGKFPQPEALRSASLLEQGPNGMCREVGRGVSPHLLDTRSHGCDAWEESHQASPTPAGRAEGHGEVCGGEPRVW